MKFLGFRMFAAMATVGACVHLGAGPGWAQASARDLQAQENAVRTAEQQRQHADEERARLVEAYRQIRTDSARSMKTITDRIQALEGHKKQAQAMAEGPQKQDLVQRIATEEKRLLAEGERMRVAAAAAQKSRTEATVKFQKAQAAEAAAKEQLARMKSGQPAAAPAANVIPAAAPAAPPPQALVNARMDVEEAEKALAAAARARHEVEAASSADAKDLTRQLSLVAEQRKRIEGMADAAKRDALLQQSQALEARIKGELQQTSAPIAAAQKAESEARARYDRATSVEKGLLAATSQAAR